MHCSFHLMEQLFLDTAWSPLPPSPRLCYTLQKLMPASLHCCLPGLWGKQFGVPTLSQTATARLPFQAWPAIGAAPLSPKCIKSVVIYSLWPCRLLLFGDMHSLQVQCWTITVLSNSYSSWLFTYPLLLLLPPYPGGSCCQPLQSILADKCMEHLSNCSAMLQHSLLQSKRHKLWGFLITSPTVTFVVVWCV